MTRFTLALASFALLRAAAFGDTVIVNEHFDSYANSAALYAQWAPNQAPSQGILWAENPVGNPAANPDGGNGVDHLGGNVMVWQTPFNIAPDATHNVVLQADLYEKGEGGKRMSVGLRSVVGADVFNIVEMGFYNSDSCDPTVCGPGQAGGTGAPQNAEPGDPGFYAGTDYGYRLQLWPTVSPPLLVNPDWQFPQLPAALDRPADTDTITNVGDIGAAWTRYTATIRQNSITIDIDLFRDGVRNASKTPGDGTPGVDGTVTWNMTPDVAGFNNLRIGSPSGVSSIGAGVVFDNVLLKLVDVAVPHADGDYNNNGTVDAADYALWRDLNGQNVTLPNDTTPGSVGPGDYAVWKANFGKTAGNGSSPGTVPEPAAIVMIAAAAIWSALGWRTR